MESFQTAKLSKAQREALAVEVESEMLRKMEWKAGK